MLTASVSATVTLTMTEEVSANVLNLYGTYKITKCFYTFSGPQEQQPPSPKKETQSRVVKMEIDLG
jgi:hypothetical protein